jgi:hypothetical protein
MALAAWCGRRRGQGGDSCSSTNSPSRPPAHSPAARDSARGDLAATSAGSPSATAASAGRTVEPAGMDRSGAAAGGAP